MIGGTLQVSRSKALNGSPKVRSTLQVLRLEALNESPKVGGTLRAPSLEALNRSPKAYELACILNQFEVKELPVSLTQFIE